MSLPNLISGCSSAVGYCAASIFSSGGVIPARLVGCKGGGECGGYDGDDGVGDEGGDGGGDEGGDGSGDGGGDEGGDGSGDEGGDGGDDEGDEGGGEGGDGGGDDEGDGGKGMTLVLASSELVPCESRRDPPLPPRRKTR